MAAAIVAQRLTRQDLLAEVRRDAEQLARRVERAGLFAHVTSRRLARAELQRCLRAEPGRDSACRCLILLARAVDGGATISQMLEQCRKLAARSRNPALQALFFTSARRGVLTGTEEARSNGAWHA